MKKFLFSLALLSSSVATAYAHDASQHKGTRYEGAVLATSGDSLQLKTDKGTEKVTLDKNTKIEVGDEGKAGKSSDVKVGDHVMVSGHKLESGEIVATEIMVHDKDGHAGNDHK
jgi:Domain of unknown function (DUF5666)